MVGVIVVDVGVEDVFEGNIVGFAKTSSQKMNFLTNIVPKVGFWFEQTIVSMEWMNTNF